MRHIRTWQYTFEYTVWIDEYRDDMFQGMECSIIFILFYRLFIDLSIDLF